MQPSDYCHERHQSGQACNDFDGTAGYVNRQYPGRFCAPFRGSRPPFRFGRWGGGAPFRGGAPSSFCYRPPCAFRGRPPPPYAPRCRPLYSFRPQRFQSPSPYFGRACYQSCRGRLDSSPSYKEYSDGAQTGHCPSPQASGSKLLSQSDARNKLTHQVQDSAPLERTISTAGAKRSPVRCRSPTPTKQHANGSGSPAKRIEPHDSTNVAKVQACSDLSSRQHACTSKTRTSDSSAAKVQTPVKTNGKASSSYKLKSVVHVPAKKSAQTSQTTDSKRTTEDSKGKKEIRISSSDTLSFPTSKNGKVANTCTKSSLNDPRYNRKRNSNIQLHTTTSPEQSVDNSAGAGHRGPSPDSTTPPCPKRIRKESTRQDTSIGETGSSVSKVAAISSDKTSKVVLPESASTNSISSPTADCVRTKCNDEALTESLHGSVGSGSGANCAVCNVIPAASALDGEIDEATEVRVGTCCTPRQCDAESAGGFIVNPLASFLESGERGIAAIQQWLAVSPRSNTSGHVPEYRTVSCKQDSFSAQESVDDKSTIPPEIPEPDIVHSPKPGTSHTTGPDLLQNTADHGISAPPGTTGGIDSDQETASYATTESEDEDCIIVKWETTTSRARQRCSDMANPGTSTCASTSGRCSTQAMRPTEQAGFAMSLEDILFELDSYTALCVLDFCEDQFAKKQVYALYLDGRRSNEKSTYTQKIKKIASAAVERRRVLWKCSTGVLRKLSKLRWSFPQVGCVPRISELYELEKR
ncbi:hypothetical protein HPB50_022129 [Hyalomma asiaticum]|uniref:Uncharacterized protein n=1 Tax=Hyalomma asiaticum TaxID=266040 RepID=A0ACB7TP99_HYAAI|nr:hypothetical protein HPB50_022129 [Hyalomma asiaticum]